MKRLYFVLPDHDSAKQLVDDLLLARIEERHIHVIAREGVEFEDLPSASLTQSSDFAQGIEKGLAAGGATGMLAGLVAITFPPLGLALGGGAVLLTTTLLGAGIGGWTGGLVSLNVPNSHLRTFEHALAEGKLLMIVDVPKDRVDEVCDLVHGKHPEAAHGGLEPTIPHFP